MSYPPALEEAVQRSGIPAAAIAVVDGNRVDCQTFACRGEAPARSAAFYLASTSKAYTATAVALAATMGLLDLDEPVQRWVPEFDLRDGEHSLQPTLRDALSMRLGLATAGACHYGFSPSLKVEQRIASASFAKRERPFRDGAGYHNIGPIVARVALERASGMPLMSFMRSELLGERSFANLTDLRRPPGPAGLVSPAIVIPGGALPVGLLVGENSLGAGGLFGSIQDAADWLRLQLGLGARSSSLDQAIAVTHAPQALIPATKASPPLAMPWLAYGMGWFVGTCHGERLLYHSGRVAGAGAMTMLWPERRFGVTAYVAGPSSAARLLAALAAQPELPGAFDIEALQRAVPSASVVEEGRPSAGAPASRAFVGSYVSAEAGRLSIREDSAGLLARFDQCPMFDGSLAPDGARRAQVVSALAAVRWDQEPDDDSSLSLSEDGSALEHAWLGRFGRVA